MALLALPAARDTVMSNRLLLPVGKTEVMMSIGMMPAAAHGMTVTPMLLRTWNSLSASLRLR